MKNNSSPTLPANTGLSGMAVTGSITVPAGETFFLMKNGTDYLLKNNSNDKLLIRG